MKQEYMTRDMNKTLMRFLSIALLMMVSIGAWAQEKYVTVNLGANNDGKFDNGTIVEAGQEREGDAVTVTLTVTPAIGYTFNKNNVTIYATLSSFSGTRTRTPEISKTLTLDGPTGDVTKATDYTVTVDANLGVWVESATFNKASSTSPRKEPQRAGADPYEGTWYITNGNNYYLCPAAGYYQGDVDKPYITTYQTNKDNSSVWTIEKAEVSGETYYRIIHNATGKYITANDAVSGFNAGYLRLHLESFDTPSDATLFIIVTYNGKIGIRSKDYNDAANNNYWFDISQGNKGNLWQDNGQGQLGFWYNITTDAGDNIVPADAKGAPWTFVAATPICAIPVITYDEAEGTFSISYPGDNTGVSIHYTTDGTVPTSSSTPYSGAISAVSVTNKLRAIAVKTDYNNSDEAVVYGTAYSATPHLFKTSDYQTVDGVNSYYDFSYYLISPVDDSDSDAGRNYLTTSNVPNARMQWLIKPATASNGVQYHYLVNAETGKYIYFTGTKLEDGSKFVVKERDEAGTEDDRFMFRIWEGTADGIDYFNFSPKLFSAYPPSHKKGNFLCKQNNTNHNDPTGIYRDDNSNGRTRWQMVDVPADRGSLSELPAEMVSDASNCVYFKLRNATQDDSSNDYFVYPPSATTYATAATSGTNPEWYLAEASDADTWNTYYHIRNAQTGDYLYFDSNTKYNTNDNKFLTSRSITSGSEDKYKFLVLKTANTTYSGTWHIVPKAIRNNNNQANIALSRENKSSAKLRSSNSRGNNNACWYLDAVDFKCESPMFSYDSGKLTITCSTSGAVIYYAIGTSEPTISDANRYTGLITLPEGTTAVTAIAVRNANASDKSDVATFAIQTITSGDQITNMSGFYYLDSNFTPSNAPIGTADNPFRGTIDGQLNSFSISHPMFYYVENAVIKNVILDNVSISSGISSEDDDNGNTGVIACVAKGSTRIYNCGILATNSTVTTDEDGYTHITSNSSTVYGSNYVGGLVGLLDGEARVINCFSYADITGGSTVGGIVGYNNVATTSQNLKTMVMNCMFYGDITGGTNKAPIYNGQIITNVSSGTGDSNANNKGVSNFNYFWGGASYVQKRDANQNPDIQKYNCALMAETRYLQRFEFFRHLLNGHLELAGWWATGSYDKSQMMKWVMEPSQIGTSTPYPILKKTGRYHSVVNIDNLDVESATSRSIGTKLGTLTVNIQMDNTSDGTVPFHHPGTGVNEAAITRSQLKLDITDKDPDHFNFNYGKVQLPYYNDVGTKNYTGNRVVTGWKIVSISDGTASFTNTGDDVTFNTDGSIATMPYNFADRKCTAKDKYSSTNKRVFNQGAYFDVPEGVESITIEPYWAKAAYIADTNVDVVYNSEMSTAYNVPKVGGGQIYTNGNSYEINGDNQVVYTSISNALGSSALNPNTSHTVHDYAIVLVGNYHQFGSIEGTKPYTVTSVDLDGDNEPDYCFMLRFDGRTKFHPVKYDFINLVGLGMAQKSIGGTGTYNLGIPQPNHWFECTNTALFRVTQMEYDTNSRKAAPYILQGGVIEQWVSGQNNGVTNGTTYIIVGGNVWFKEFHLGCHIDKTDATKHPPVSVTGGDYDAFYLTGLYSNAGNYNDNAECYINGGRFGTVAGTGMEGVGKTSDHSKGHITWQIDNADIDNFYGGGINAAKIAEGNINTIISNSRVGVFCGGPQFGDMNNERTVKTTATGCTFGTFYGAGYGGNSYYTAAPRNFSDQADPWTSGEARFNLDWDAWVEGTIKASTSSGNYSNGTAYTGYHRDYIAAFGGVSSGIAYEFLPSSDNKTNVARLFLKFVKFSLATTRNVTSTLTDCIITGNFYGGGRLGKVTGPVTSVLTDCEVHGNVFGAGFSADLPTVEMMKTGGFKTQPHYDKNAGVYLPGEYKDSDTYTWEHSNGTVNSTATAIKAQETDNASDRVLYTNENLEKSNLGSVAGTVSLTIDGSSDKGSTITGNVYGGGEQSYVTGTDNTVTVTLKGKTTVIGSVYGGGDQGVVEGSTTVNIKNED